MSDVLGLEGIKYSHIQHADLSKIEIELHEMGLNRAHHALLQGMRTQDILYKRIEACSTSEDQPTQVERFDKRRLKFECRGVGVGPILRICIPIVRRIYKIFTVGGGFLLLDLVWSLQM